MGLRVACIFGEGVFVADRTNMALGEGVAAFEDDLCSAEACVNYQGSIREPQVS